MVLAVTAALVALLLGTAAPAGAVGGTARAETPASSPSLGEEGALPAVRTVSTTVLNAALGESAKLAVSQFPGDTVRVVVTASAGTLALGTTAGLTAPTGYPSDFSGAEIAFRGSAADVNAALDSLTYTAEQTAGETSIEVSAAAEFSGVQFNPDNGHFYEFVTGDLVWATARASAQSRRLGGDGVSGYLATITTAAENAFVTDKTGGSAAWIGGSDLAQEGAWTWMDGPEAGQTFWVPGCGTGAVGVCATTGAYNSWNTGEPNDVGGEDALQILAGGSGLWNDLPHESISAMPMIVEYSEPDGSPVAGLSASRTLALTVREAGVDDDACAAAPSLVNGDFETPAIAAAGVEILDTSTAGVTWKNTAENWIEYWSSGFQGIPAQSGNQFVEMNAYTRGTLYQDLATTPGQTLRWSLWHRARADTGTNTMKVMIGVPNGALTQSGPNITTGLDWANYTGTYTVPEGQTTTRFAFESVSPSDAAAGNLLDNITFTTLGCSAAPSNLVAAGGDGFATVSFTSGDDGGYPITNYAYSVDGGAWTALATPDVASPLTIPGLGPGRDYTIALRALNATGVGAPSPAAQVRMPTIDENAQISTWQSLAVGADGSLYVAARDTEKILVFAPGASGNTAPARTISGASTGLSGKPHGIAVGSDGSIYVTAYYDDAVLVFAPNADGDVAPARTITATGMTGPHGIALDGDTVYVSSQLGPSILALPAAADGATAALRTITGAATGLTNPRTLAIGPDAKLYVSDDSVRVFDLSARGNASPARTLPTGGNTGMEAPAGLATDPVTGTVYVASMNNDSIRAFAATAGGNVRPVRILRGVDTGLDRPTSLAVHTDDDGSTRLYAANPGNGSLRAYVIPPSRR